MALIVGLITGILAAVYKDSAIDSVTMMLALFGLSMPAFWFGLLMIYFFGVQLRWFPVMGSSSWRHLVLPAMTLGLIASTVQARVTRSSMLEVLNSDYVRTARAKGLSENVVILRHGLKNALIPTVTILGLQVGALLGGAFIIESVFAWHGIGELAVQAITQRDFPLIQGIIVVVAITYVVVNLFVDLSYRALDPGSPMTESRSIQSTQESRQTQRSLQLADETMPASRSGWRWLMRDLFSKRPAQLGGLIVLLLVVAAIFAPLIAPYDPYAINLDDQLVPPNLQHPFGTDDLGAICSAVSSTGRARPSRRVSWSS